MAAARITPVILSGGAGTRLWPLSRPDRPKQFQALTGAATMLQMTAERVRDPAFFNPPILVASDRHREQVAAQLGAAGLAPQLTILEPVGRNTAAAIALAALAAEPSSLLLVMPSDHVIGRPDRFLEAVLAAAPHAQSGYLVTFGITPQHPETGYGYVKQAVAIGNGAWAVERFVEKPDRQTAERYLKEGGYFWNGGIFLFRADRLLAGLGAHAPDILHQARASFDLARRDADCLYPEAEAFSGTPSRSIDHALMELDDKVGVVPVDMDWSDLGSFDALFELGATDKAGNRAAGDVLAPDARNCLIHSDGPLVVASGVEDLIIVAAGGAVLVLPRGQSQRVKELVDELKAAGHPLGGS